MIFRFNKAQLGRDKEVKLDAFLHVFHEKFVSEKEEIEIIAVEFPSRFCLKVGERSAVVVWDDNSADYKVQGADGGLCDIKNLKAESQNEPEQKPDPNEKVGDIKEWQRPEKSPEPEQHGSLVVELPGPAAPEPAPEIKVTVDNVVTLFMGLPKEQRPAFFSEVWKLINAEVGV